MRKSFPGHLRGGDDELAKLWGDCLFSFDASSLLNLYRYSTETSQALLNIISAVGDRIWLPHQVGLEFTRNRLTVISEQEATYGEVRKSLNKALTALQAPREHPFLSADRLKRLEAVLTEVEQELEDRKKKHASLSTDDPVLKQVFDLFDGKVGAPYSADKLAEIYKDGATRYDNKVPPGYEDRKSKEDDARKYGDLVVWYQLIDKAKEGRPIIFVSDDGKEDWWLLHHGSTLGPRPELIAEMIDKANAQFYMYQPWRFMEYARRFLNQAVQETAIEEARAVEAAKREDDAERALEDALKVRGEVEFELLRRRERESIEQVMGMRELVVEELGDIARKALHRWMEEGSVGQDVARAKQLLAATISNLERTVILAENEDAFTRAEIATLVRVIRRIGAVMGQDAMDAQEMGLFWLEGRKHLDELRILIMAMRARRFQETPTERTSFPEKKP
jgi:PIN like domain